MRNQQTSQNWLTQLMWGRLQPARDFSPAPEGRAGTCPGRLEAYPAFRHRILRKLNISLICSAGSRRAGQRRMLAQRCDDSARVGHQYGSDDWPPSPGRSRMDFEWVPG